MVLLQVLNVPWPWEPLFVWGFQVIAALLGVVDNSVGSFPCGAKFSLGRVFSRCDDLTQDEVAYVKSSELYPIVVVFGHLLLVLRHSAGSLVSYFVQIVQVDSQVIVIVFFVEYLSLDVGYSYLNRDHCFSAIGESEGGFSRWGSCCGSVGPQDVGQFFRPGTFRVVQLSFDNLEQCSIRYLCLSIRLRMPWG